METRRSRRREKHKHNKSNNQGVGRRGRSEAEWEGVVAYSAETDRPCRLTGLPVSAAYTSHPHKQQGDPILVHDTAGEAGDLETIFQYPNYGGKQ